jgi:hypothetical protein
MGIFEGIEILFFALGALSVLFCWGLVHARKKYGLKCPVMILGGCGAFLLLFCIAWSASSILEGEPQAANLGLLVFGTPVLLIFGTMRRMIRKSAEG